MEPVNLLELAAFVVLSFSVGIYFLFQYITSLPLYKPGFVKTGQVLGGLEGLSPLQLKKEGDKDAAGNDSDELQGKWKMSDVPDIDLHYESTLPIGADCKAVVLVVHGGPGAPYEVIPPVFKAASSELNVNFIFYHQRGCGLSSDPFKKGFTLESSKFKQIQMLEGVLGIGQQVADIERIRRILQKHNEKNSKLIICGHSFGAYLATMYATEFPENVRGLLLVCPANLIALPAKEDIFNQIEKKLPQNVVSEFRSWKSLYLDIANVFDKKPDYLRNLHSKFQHYFLLASGKKEIPPMNSLLGGFVVPAIYFSLGRKYNVRKEIESAATKFNSATIQVVHGAEDLQNIDVAKEYKQALHSKEEITVLDAGHFPFVEDEKGFMSTLRNFISKVSS